MNPKDDSDLADKILYLERILSTNLKSIHFESPVAYVYDPLQYAYDLHATFLRKFCTTPKKELLYLGMNPGPWGMAQTGIPFGEHKIVNEWFQMTGEVRHPEREHPARPILGLNCQRSEVSGKKFWGFFKDLCVTPEVFFKHSFVYNVCPLYLMSESGKNITPAELKNKSLKQFLLDMCEETLFHVLITLQTELIIGIGKFAEGVAKKLIEKKGLQNIKVISIPHPSPRNLNCKDWPGTTENILRQNNLLKYYGGS